MQGGLDTVEEYWRFSQVERAYQAATGESYEALRADIAHFLNVAPDRIWGMPSARRALEWLLRGLKHNRRDVLVPAFNCGVVKEAIEAAGYQPKLYDFNNQPGFFDWEQVRAELTPSTAALIVTHYFGTATDFRTIAEYCNTNGIAVIEDCAHTLGARIDGRTVGTIGSASVFSFNYDKPISLGWGGVAVINDARMFKRRMIVDEIKPEIDREFRMLQDFNSAMAYRRKVIPKHNSFASRLLRRAGLIKPIVFKNTHNFSIGAVQAELGRWSIQKYSEIIHIRNLNAQRVAHELQHRSWPVAKGVTPAWLKQKVYIRDLEKARRLSRRLQSRGLRVGNFNWPVLLNGNECSRYPVAKQAAYHWVDVPIHQNVTPKQLDEIIKVLKEVA